MKIVDIKTHALVIPVDPPIYFSTRVVPFREFTVTQVFTDEGIVGESTVPIGDPVSVAAFIDRKLKQVVIGKDPFATERIWEDMHRVVYRDRKGAAIRAIGAIDIALWDIKGKALGMPLHRLLGGDGSPVACYASGGYYYQGRELYNTASEMALYVEKGFKSMKMKVGGASLEADVARVRTAREIIGPDRLLLVDANNGYDTATAIALGRRLEEYGVYFFEEPVKPNNLPGSKRVADALDIPVASGELEYTLDGFRDLIEHGGVDMIQPDATVLGGITEFLKVAALARAYHIPVAPHWEQEIHMHLVGALPNALFVEYFMREINVRVEDKLYVDFIEPVDGMLPLPEAPGLGTQLIPGVLDRYRI
jgi:D-arabinonate dehydratase